MVAALPLREKPTVSLLLCFLNVLACTFVEIAATTEALRDLDARLSVVLDEERLPAVRRLRAGLKGGYGGGGLIGSFGVRLTVSSFRPGGARVKGAGGAALLEPFRLMAGSGFFIASARGTV